MAYVPVQSATWVAASATRNWCHADPLLDWLDLYGQQNGFTADHLREGFDPKTDMGRFLRDKGRAFEAAVMARIEQKTEVVRIAQTSRDASDVTLFEATLDAMRRGVEILAQPVLWDSERQTYGMPDLLVRSDVLNRLVEEPCMSIEESIRPAPELNGTHHYRIVDIKFTNLDLLASGFIGNDGSDRRRKAQLLVYNRALGQMQGFEPWTAYVLGRSWKQRDERGDSCFDRLGPADMTDVKLGGLVDDAIAWVRQVREVGESWQVLPQPSVTELYPNMSNTQDAPWHMAKKEIAEAMGELTLLWRVTPNNRPNAHAAGIYHLGDPRCQSTIFGLPEGYAAKLHLILEANRGTEGVRPRHILADEQAWREPKPLEFYVDFETVSDLDDDFSRLPNKGGQPLIFMVGCGYVEDGNWRFKSFTCDRLTEPCEEAMIDDWHEYMAGVRTRLWPEGDPMVFHWSHAENTTLNKAYNSARARHGRDWPDLKWYDFLAKVVREEPVVAKGALAFGLKAVANAMHQNGLIETDWTNGPGDGLAAMVGAWSCETKAKAHGGNLIDLPLMQSIERYNWVDCKVMQEIVAYLREHH